MSTLFLHNVIRGLLITVIVLNALLSNTGFAQAKEEGTAITNSQSVGEELEKDPIHQPSSADAIYQ